MEVRNPGKRARTGKRPGREHSRMLRAKLQTGGVPCAGLGFFGIFIFPKHEQVYRHENDTETETIEQIHEFPAATSTMAFSIRSKDECYRWIGQISICNSPATINSAARMILAQLGTRFIASRIFANFGCGSSALCNFSSKIDITARCHFSEKCAIFHRAGTLFSGEKQRYAIPLQQSIAPREWFLVGLPTRKQPETAGKKGFALIPSPESFLSERKT
uniref:Uncharacterized protein n=1 Tax=Candidatus Kentrum sp. SD TaxID=2126332 RepID=A0A450YTA3_9GAMM|nr:MAG: hypothetical protein BECKSD772F_GA0070984_104219 [Candidatus Kentron sp. SD]VFK44699.1 MAG: hypothetical protein BECKSD772E_GA0070983_104220 [Candidatus Kentron sp. SD]